MAVCKKIRVACRGDHGRVAHHILVLNGRLFGLIKLSVFLRFSIPRYLAEGARTLPWSHYLDRDNYKNVWWSPVGRLYRRPIVPPPYRDPVFKNIGGVYRRPCESGVGGVYRRPCKTVNLCW